MMKYTNFLTQADRDMFDRIDRDCIAMHVVPPPKTFLKLEVADGAGELVEVYEDRAHSWVRNAYNFFASQSLCLGTGPTGVYGAGTIFPKTTTGTSYTSSNSGTYLLGFVTNTDFTGAVGISTQGIVIGRGTTAESFESYSLATEVTHGASSNQMSYSAQTATSRDYDAGLKKLTATFVRVFNNNSGASIDVSEVGIYVYAHVNKFMFCRDLLASAVTVPNAGQLTVTYTIEMTFPE